MRRRPSAALRRAPWLAAVLAAGLLARAVLIPVTHGDDFVVWDLATRATLAGHDVYAHHPDYPHGPFAYFPLFLYLELPFQWLAQHGAGSFVVLGKLPIAAADLACAVLLAGALRRRGCAERTVAVGVAAFFLNPLVLYNSAWYGRFDTLGCALLLVALRGFETERALSWRTSIWYGLAVVAKTFPGFVLFGVLRAAGARWQRLLVGLVAVIVVVCAPYLPSAYALGHDIVFYDAGKAPGGLSWQHLITGIAGSEAAKLVSYLLLVAFVGAAIRLSRMDDLARYAAVVLVLFILTSKVVLEQYLIWPLPWLIVLGLAARNRLARASLALGAVFTVVGMLDNESFHPLGRAAPPFIVLVTAAAAGWALVAVRAANAARTA